MIQKDDMFQLLDINDTEATLEKPMTMDMLLMYITKKFEEQPLKYFNIQNGLRVIHLRSRMIMPIGLKVELKGVVSQSLA